MYFIQRLLPFSFFSDFIITTLQLMKLVLRVNLCWEGQTPSALPRLPLLNLSKPWSHQTKRWELLIKRSLGLKCTHYTFLKEAMMLFSWLCSLASSFTPVKGLTLYTLTSVCIFSILFSTHFQRGWQGEFVSQSRAALGGDHLLYSHDFHVWFRGDIVRRNQMLVTFRR